MPQPPRITIAIPVFNGENYLAETIDSLSRQTFRDFEIICANDCSTDESLKVLERLARTDPRLRVLSTPHNFGSASPVLNFITDHAKGERIVYSSQDDLFSSDWLEKMIARADETGADAIIPDLVFFHPTEPVARSLIGVRGDRSLIISGREAVDLSLSWTIPGNCLWKASIWREIKFPNAGAWADEYAVRLFFLNCNCVAFSGGTFFYRQDNPNAITKKFSLKKFDIPEMEMRVLDLLRTNGFATPLILSQLTKAMQIVVNLDSSLRSQRLPFDEKTARGRLHGFLSDFRQPWIKPFLRSQWGNMSLRQKALALACTNGKSAFYAGAAGGAAIRSIRAALRTARSGQFTQA